MNRPGLHLCGHAFISPLIMFFNGTRSHRTAAAQVVKSLRCEAVILSGTRKDRLDRAGDMIWTGLSMYEEDLVERVREITNGR